MCGQLYCRLVDPRNRAALVQALRDQPGFSGLLGSVMDAMNLPANNDMPSRLYSMTVLQAYDFDNLYDNKRVQTFAP